MQPKFNLGDRAYIIESSIYVKEVEIVKVSGGFYLIKYPNKTGGYRVKESRLYKTEAEAMAADNGFNFFLILSGTIDNLRDQTNTRLISDLNSQGCGIAWTGLNNLGSRGSTKLLDLRLDKRNIIYHHKKN